MRFYLGSHRPDWLGKLDVPLFVSHRQLRDRKTFPVARAQWALDSGGFTELDKPPHRWVTTPEEYVEAVALYGEQIGNLAWASPMDWMCEPWIVEKTGLSVEEHQERTVANYVLLKDQGPFIPVLQGWTLEDYYRCIDLYDQAGVDLVAEPVVGLGSVCRRQATDEIARVVGALASTGIRCHGFGMKSRGLEKVADLLTSADSMAWSSRGRNAWYYDDEKLCGGSHRGGCANCSTWALMWRERVVDRCGMFAEAA